MREYFVYIMANRSGMLYTGVTSDLASRTYQHKTGTSGFTGRYRMNRLVYYESTSDIRAAIEREKQIKRWRREKKLSLIRRMNPRLIDLAPDIG